MAPDDIKHGDRKKLPARRSQETFEVLAGTADTSISKWLVSAGYHGAGELAEIFIASGKSGSELNFMALELAIVTSIALQYGAPEEVLRNAMPRDDKGEPQWILGAFFDIHALRQIADGKREV